MDASKMDARHLITSFAKDNRQVSQLQFIRDDPEGIDIKNLENGYVNFTFKVTSKDKLQSVVLKHSRPACKEFPTIEMPMFRQEIEYGTMTKIYSLLPGGCPEPYCYDKANAMIAMEDLSDMTLLWESLCKHLSVDLKVYEQLAQLCAGLHWGTMRENVSEQEWDRMVALYRRDFSGSDSKSFFFDHWLNADHPITELVGEMKPFFQDLQSDPEVVKIASQLRDLVSTEECLVHNDCNERAVFFKKDRCALFDFEFSGLGPRAVDIGLPMIPLILPTLFLVHPDQDQLKRTCRLAFTHFFETYLENMPDLKDPEKRGHVISQTTACLSVYVFRCVTACSLKQLNPNLPTPPGMRVKVMDLMIKILKKYTSITTLEEMTQQFFHNL